MHQGLTLASDGQVTRSQDTRVAGCSALEAPPDRRITPDLSFYELLRPAVVSLRANGGFCGNPPG